MNKINGVDWYDIWLNGKLIQRNLSWTQVALYCNDPTDPTNINPHDITPSDKLKILPHIDDGRAHLWRLVNGEWKCNCPYHNKEETK